MRSLTVFAIFALFFCALRADAVDLQCQQFDDPTLDPATTWGGIDLTDGFAGVHICTPIYTTSGFRLEDATYPSKVGRCVVKLGAIEYAFDSPTHAGQFYSVFVSASVFDPSGSVLSEVWCEEPDGTKGTVVSAIPTVVPVTEPLPIPLQQAP